MFRQALAHREKLAAEHPNMNEYRQLVATSHHNLALLFKDMGKLEAALAAYSQALALQEKLVAEFPDVLPYQTKLAATLSNFGGRRRKNGRAAKSLKSYARGMGFLKRWWEGEPRLNVERQFLRTAYGGRALARDKLDRPADAIADWDQAVELALPQ